MSRLLPALLLALTLTALPALAQKSEAAAAAKAQQWPRAVTLYKQVVDKDPSDGPSWYELGSAAMQANDPKTAVTAFEHSLALRVRPAFSSYNLAVRLTFTPLDGGRVRQLGEATSDNGKTWNVTYDFIYVPKK